MIREDKTPTKKMLSTKNNMLMINRKYPIGDITLHVVYLSTWSFLLLWEIVDVLINRKKNISFIVIISMVLVMYIANMLR